MAFVILPTNSASGGYNITNSLRFNSASSDRLNRTPASAGNRQKYTLSFWVKRSKLSTTQQILEIDTGATANFLYFASGSDQLVWYCYSSSGGVTDFYLQPNQVFRDVSAWYHIMLVVDTTLATADNRGRIYVNGSEVTSMLYRTNPTQNLNTLVNNTNQHNISGASYLDLYLSEMYLIDGQALTPSSFGETDEDTGIWKPKAYTGSYGTNGFYLQFKNSASLGTDSSGNGNTFTVNNLTSIDQTTDTPTNNFCTLNPLASGVAIGGLGGNFTEGNTIFTGASANWCASKGTFSVTKGKWYFEAKQKTNANGSGLGSGTVAVGFSHLQSNLGNYNPVDGNVAIYIIALGDNGWVSNFNANASQLSPAYAIQDGDIVGVALDLDTNAYNFYINGSSKKSGSLDTLYNGNGLTPCIIQYGGDTRNSFFNFGNPSYTANGYTDGAGYGNFSYAVPSGYYSLCSRNLAQFG